MKRKGRLIALLTDFGYGDPYVASMKGVILTISPDAQVVDITHDIPRHDIRSAAYHLSSVIPYYPAGTVFACVVDPGVGTGRNILCLEKGGQTFLAPGNGLLNYIVDRNGKETVYSLTRVTGSHRPSKTFHGRDIFAPAAAQIAGGKKASVMGTKTEALEQVSLYNRPPRKGGPAVRSKVLHVDHFGNIITDMILPAGSGSKYSVSIGRKRIQTYSGTYGDARRGRPFYLRGSTGLLEISLREDDASRSLKVKTGDQVTIRRTD